VLQCVAVCCSVLAKGGVGSDLVKFITLCFLLHQIFFRIRRAAGAEVLNFVYFVTHVNGGGGEVHLQCKYTCMYTHIYIYIYICIYKCIHIYVYTNMNTHCRRIVL